MITLAKGHITDQKRREFTIQVEEWFDDYPNIMAYVVGVYVKAIADGSGYFAPRRGNKFRCAFEFWSEVEAMEMYNNIISGTKELEDYAQHLEHKDYYVCLTGKEWDGNE